MRAAIESLAWAGGREWAEFGTLDLLRELRANVVVILCGSLSLSLSSVLAKEAGESGCEETVSESWKVWIYLLAGAERTQGYHETAARELLGDLGVWISIVCARPR